MSTIPKVAIIGLGNIGRIVAANLVKGKRPVILADRNWDKVTKLANELGELARPAGIPEAVMEAEIIVLAIYFDAIKSFLIEYGKALKGKIIVDPSNPIAPAANGGFQKIVGEKESSGQLLSTLLPDGVKLAKSFGSLGAATLQQSAFQGPDAAVLFYATDDTSINPIVEQLIRDSGFAPIRLGGLDQSIRMEVFGDLHEFGALGKSVTVVEAAEMI